MSDILDFIIKNFGQLRPTDYLVLALFGALVAGASFLALRWIFLSRFQAQKDLLDLQAQTVSTLATHLELTKRERDDLRKELEEKMRRLAEMEGKTSTSPIELAAIREQALVLAGRRIIALLDRVALAYNMLYVYKQVHAEAAPTDAIAALEHFSARVTALRELHEKTASQEHRESLGELVFLTNSEDIRDSARSVFVRFSALGDGIVAKVNSRKKDG